MRGTWTQIDEDVLDMEQQLTGDDLARLKLDTEEWCRAERMKIENEWKRLDRLRERMSVLLACCAEVLQINCSGAIFQVPKRALCFIEGRSFLNHMFSDAYTQSVPRDSQGRYFLDFNPECFGIIVDWLLKLEERMRTENDKGKENQDILAEALSLRQFVFGNCLRTNHATSLKVPLGLISDHSRGGATHMGWQIISAEHPLKMSGRVYNSNVGLIGDVVEANNCEEKLLLLCLGNSEEEVQISVQRVQRGQRVQRVQWQFALKELDGFPRSRWILSAAIQAL
eukprot:Skav222199  [mRNA]  locus=scaffold1745:99281:109781:- [translate_table: standard]